LLKKGRKYINEGPPGSTLDLSHTPWRVTHASSLTSEDVLSSEKLDSNERRKNPGQQKQISLIRPAHPEFVLKRKRGSLSVTRGIPLKGCT